MGVYAEAFAIDLDTKPKPGNDCHCEDCRRVLSSSAKWRIVLGFGTWLLLGVQVFWSCCHSWLDFANDVGEEEKLVIGLEIWKTPSDLRLAELSSDSAPQRLSRFCLFPRDAVFFSCSL